MRGALRVKPFLSDEECIRKVQAGNPRAYDELVLRYYPQILRLLRRYLKDADSAPDLAQEIFWRAFRALPEFRFEASFRSWLFQIAINSSQTQLRKQINSPEICIDPQLFYADMSLQERLTDSSDPLAELLTLELNEEIFSAIEALPEPLKTTLLLRELLGMSYQQIADCLAIPEGTVRSRLLRAREQINSVIYQNKMFSPPDDDIDHV